jgi:hypothetical protein
MTDHFDDDLPDKEKHDPPHASATTPQNIRLETTRQTGRTRGTPMLASPPRLHPDQPDRRSHRPHRNTARACAGQNQRPRSVQTMQLPPRQHTHPHARPAQTSPRSRRANHPKHPLPQHNPPSQTSTPPTQSAAHPIRPIALQHNTIHPPPIVCCGRIIAGGGLFLIATLATLRSRLIYLPRKKFLGGKVAEIWGGMRKLAEISCGAITFANFRDAIDCEKSVRHKQVFVT